MEFESRIKSCQDEAKEAKDILLYAEKQMEDEINKIKDEIDKIKEKYQPIIRLRKDCLNQVERDLYDTSRLMAKYSKFDKNDFGKILASLTSLVTGEDYVYGGISSLRDLYYNQYVIKVMPRSLIGHLTTKEQLYDDRIILIGFNEGKIYRESFFYYNIEKKDQEKSLGVNNYNLVAGGGITNEERFSYLNDFIDYMIEYKVRVYEEEELSYDDMIYLLKEYLSSIMDVIENEFQKLDEQDEINALSEAKEKQVARRRTIYQFINS